MIDSSKVLIEQESSTVNLDDEDPERETLKIFLFELPKKFAALNFLVELQDKISYERELSIQAGAIVAKIYDGLRGARNIRQDLLELFKILNMPTKNRSPYLDDTLKKFPYVDGGLFKDEMDLNIQWLNFGKIQS